MNKKQTRIALIDDHALFREGVKSTLEQEPSYRVVYEGASAEAFLEALPKLAIDLLVLDISLTGMSGMQLLELIQDNHPKPKIIVLSMYEEEEFGSMAIRLGASAYLNKTSVATDLMDGVKAVLANRRYLSERLFDEVIKGSSEKTRLPHQALSKREFEILLLLAQGLRPIDVAEKLFISIKTVSTHKYKIFDKLNLKHTTDLIMYAIRHNLIKDSSQQSKRYTEKSES